MLQVTVKTLDSQNHSFEAPDECTVKEFKEQIASTLNIPADKQRLIFCGKVLKDEKKLNEYDVNGKVLHVVQTLPPPLPGSGSGATTSSGAATGDASNSGSRGNNVFRDASGFVVGAFSIPQDMMDANHVQNIVQDVVSGMGEVGRNATVMSRQTGDGSVDVHINLGRINMQMPLQNAAQLHMNRIQTFLIRANSILDHIEDQQRGTSSNATTSAATSEAAAQQDNPQPESAANEETDQAMETDPDLAAEADQNSANSTSADTSTNNESSEDAALEVTTEFNMNNGQGIRLEGLAQAAQTAISAAMAAAVAASRIPNVANRAVLIPETVTRLLAQGAAAPPAQPQASTTEPDASATEPDVEMSEDASTTPPIPTAADIAMSALQASENAGVSIPMPFAMQSAPPLEIFQLPPEIQESFGIRRIGSEMNLNDMMVVEVSAGDRSPPQATARRGSAPEIISTASLAPRPAASGAAPEAGSGRTGSARRRASRPSRRITLPSVQNFGNLLEEYLRVVSRTTPVMERLRELLRTDAACARAVATQQNRFFIKLSQLMHYLSHIMHSMSDLVVDFNQAPPRWPWLRPQHYLGPSAQVAFGSGGMPQTANASTSTTFSAIPRTQPAAAQRATTTATTTASAFRPVNTTATSQPAGVATTQGTIPIPPFNLADMQIRFQPVITSVFAAVTNAQDTFTTTTTATSRPATANVQPTASTSAQPAKANTTQPTSADTTQPASADTTQPAKSSSTQATQTEGTQLNDAGPTQPSNSGNAPSENANATEKANADAAQPAKVDATQPAKAAASQPASAGASQPNTGVTTAQPVPLLPPNVQGSSSEWVIFADGSVENTEVITISNEPLSNVRTPPPNPIGGPAAPNLNTARANTTVRFIPSNQPNVDFVSMRIAEDYLMSNSGLFSLPINATTVPPRQAETATSTVPTSVTQTTTASSSTTSTSSSAAGPSTSGTQQPRGSHRPNQWCPLAGHNTANNVYHNLIPMIHGLGTPFDVALPCNSYWAAEPSRRRHNASRGGTRRVNTSSTTATSTSTSSTNPQPAPVLRIRRNGNSTTAQATVGPTFSGRSYEQFDHMINNLLSSVLTYTEQEAGRAPAGQNQPATGSPNADAETEDRLSNVIMQQVSDFMFPGESRVYDVLGDLRQFISYEDILGNILVFITQHLTMMDLMSISFGNYASLTNLRTDLQSYLLSDVFHVNSVAEITEEHRRSIEQQIFENADPAVNIFVDSVRVNEPSNYRESLRELLREAIKNLLSQLLSQEEEYGARLIYVLNTSFNQFLFLNHNCLVEGNEGILRMATDRIINPLLEAMDPPFADLIRQYLLDILRRIFSTFNVTTEPAVSSSATPAQPPTDKAKKPQENQVSAPGTPTTSVPSTSTQSNAANSVAAMNSFSRFAEQTAAALLRNGIRGEDAPQISLTEYIPSGENFNGTVPSGWIPIITRDVHRQRRQASQGPFSDAYLSGLPPKRRRVMIDRATTLLERPQNFFSNLLSQAISQVNAQPTTSIEEVRQEAENDPNLQASFSSHVRNAIQDRLRQDLDYQDEKFPNSKKYYEPK